MNLDGREIVKHYESLHDGDLKQIGLQPKLCPAGIWTQGYGRAMRKKNGSFMTSKNTTKAQAEAAATIHTIEDAEKALTEDLLEFSAKIMPMIKVPVTDNQFSSCVSLAYNIGHGAFSTSSVLRGINSKNFIKAANSFALWNKGGGKILQGLVKRRESEKQLFLKK